MHGRIPAARLELIEKIAARARKQRTPVNAKQFIHAYYHGVSEEQHVHLVCRACGGVDDVSAGVLDALALTLAKEKAFLVDKGHVALFGVCGTCGGEA